MPIVVRIGGSVIASPPNPELIRIYAKIIKELKGKGCEMVIICGGGSIARNFIKIAKDIGLDEPEQDEVAISISRVIAQLLAMKLGNHDWKAIPTSVQEVSENIRKKGLVVMGGLKPGMTTDAVAALVSLEIGAEIIVKATDQKGVYTMDPKRYPNARKLDELTFTELEKLQEHNIHKAGIHQIIDPEAVRLLKNGKTKIIVVDGSKPENLVAAIRGEKIGTLIK